MSLGIFNGVSATQMAPMRSITRQEAFTVLARAFGLYPQNRRAYTRFRDGEKVQPYARDAVSALAEVGCVTGYDTGYLKPGTRFPARRWPPSSINYWTRFATIPRSCGDRLRPLPGHGASAPGLPPGGAAWCWGRACREAKP